MITFGYKSRFNGLLRAVTAIAVGVVMILSRTNALELAVRIIAAFLVASGVVSMIVGVKYRANGTMGLMNFNGVVDIFLGLALFLFPGFVAGLLVFGIGLLLMFFGVFQIIALSSANRVMKVGVLAFVMPVLVFSAGLFLLASPSFVGEAIGVVAGAALVLYGISELLSSWKMRKAIGRENGFAGIKDVDFEKVDEQ